MPLPLLLLTVALVFVLLEMTATFALAQRLRNFGIVDIVWSAGFTLVVWLYVGLVAVRTYDLKFAALVLGGLVTVWSLRLGGHLLIRVKSHHPVEDVRYAKLREQWGTQTGRKMFGFFLLQGFLQVVLSVPWLMVALDDTPGRWFRLNPWAWTGMGIWLVGLVGESIADRQLAKFRGNPANKGKVCQAGLWNYSRHPNYFFEWLIWVGYAVFALGSPLGCVGLIAPLLMWHFLVNVTGVPMTEELSLKSKGDAYREYQRTTNAFLPWFKKKPASITAQAFSAAAPPQIDRRRRGEEKLLADIVAPLLSDHPGSKPLYLAPLNLVWSDQGKEADLAIFASVAANLHGQPDLWRAMILDRNWRMTLAACTCLLVSRNKDFRESLEQKFCEGSWVTPQIAVTMGLLHPSTTLAFFTRLFESGALSSTKQQVSAMAVGRHLGACPSDFNNAGSPASSLDEEEAIVAKKVVAEHWAFWSERLSRF